MTDYYKTLGLKQGASELEIKRAYFKLVRQYPPEKDPEKFREIRDAYEQLQKPAEAIGPGFEAPSDPIAQRFLKLIKSDMDCEDYETAMNACEEILHVFPDETEFRYLLAINQRNAGKTGKAVKTCELLVKNDPENVWYHRELALSCMDRGYSKKALTAFRKAYELGCRDIEFVITYSVQCDMSGKRKIGSDLLFELVNRDTKWNRDQISDIIEAYSGLIAMNTFGKANRMNEILDSLSGFLQKYRIYIEADFDSVQLIVSNILALKYPSLSDYPYSKANSIIDILEKNCRQKQNLENISQMRDINMLRFLELDSRFGIEFYFYIQHTAGLYDDEGLDRYSQLDAKLCLIARREEALNELALLKKDYPDIYLKLSVLEALLLDEKRLSGQKTSMQNELEYLSNRYDGALYYTRYPNERVKNRETVIYSGDNSTPYVRSAKKTGRNDPCPCGSGKKYKHCCGR